MQVKEDALNYLASNSNGDVRSAMNSLELAVLTTNMNENGEIVIDKQVILDCTFASPNTNYKTL